MNVCGDTFVAVTKKLRTMQHTPESTYNVRCNYLMNARDNMAEVYDLMCESVDRRYADLTFRAAHFINYPTQAEIREYSRLLDGRDAMLEAIDDTDYRSDFLMASSMGTVDLFLSKE